MDDMEALAIAAAAKKKRDAQGGVPNSDGTYGQPPEGMFMNPQTGQMTSRELLKGGSETSPMGALQTGLIQGYSLDTVDEAAGAMGGDFMRERARAQIEANAEAHPVADLTGRVAGAVFSPVTKVAGQVNTARKAMAVGAAYGGLEGFFSGEGGATERLKKAGWDAATGTLFAGLTSAVGKGAHRAVTAAFQRADKRPTVDSLKAAKNAAYASVRRAGIEFDADEMLALSQRVARRMQIRDFDDIADPQTAASLRIISKRQGPITLNRLDKLRQNMWDRYGRSDEVGILDIIAEIDNTIARAAEGNDLLKAARAANSKFSKAQMLDDAFRKARRQTAATGSGGNILNKYRQAIVSILESPKKAKWFSQEELALMDSFVMGDNAENALRRVGKLSPGGNGLMTALNVYAAAIDPTMLAISAGATAAKGGADRSAMRGAEAIQDAVATGVIQAPKAGPNLRPLAVGGAAAGNEGLER